MAGWQAIGLVLGKSAMPGDLHVSNQSRFQLLSDLRVYVALYTSKDHRT